MIEVSEGLSAGCWREDAPALYLVQTRCAWGVHVYSPANLKPDQPASRRPCVWARVSAREKAQVGIQGDLRMQGAFEMSV